MLRERGETARVSVLSFHDAALAEIHALLPEVRTVLVASDLGADLVPRAQAVGARLVSLDLTRLSLDAVRRCHAAGIAVMAWSVNTPQDWALVRALGLDGAATDLPPAQGRDLPPVASGFRAPQ